MAALIAGGLAYLANLAVVFGLYPYRDYVKIFDAKHRTVTDPVRFCLNRYRGMLANPSQPLLLAAPQGLLYFGYVLGQGGFTGAILGGVLAGYTKVSVATIARRMSVSSRYNCLSHLTYSSLFDCIISSRRQFGLFSFFIGGLATSLISVLWHGASLALLNHKHNEGMMPNAWDAFRIHALLTFLSNPIRNTFRSSLAQRERSGGLQRVRDYITGEAAIFKEARGVFLAMCRMNGISFFLEGVLRTTFKTSVPFAITYGLFRSFGGSIGRPNPSTGGGGGRGGHLGGRRFLLRH